MLAQFLADKLSHMPPCRRRVVTGIRISSQVLSLWKLENNDTEGYGWVLSAVRAGGGPGLEAGGGELAKLGAGRVHSIPAWLALAPVFLSVLKEPDNIPQIELCYCKGGDKISYLAQDPWGINHSAAGCEAEKTRASPPVPMVGCPESTENTGDTDE